MRKLLIFTIILLMAGANIAQEGTFDIEWDQVDKLCDGRDITQADVKYIVFWSTTPGAPDIFPPNGYEESMGPIFNTSTTITGLQECTDYYIVVGSRRHPSNQWGESCEEGGRSYSNEISGWARPRLTSVDTPALLMGIPYTLVFQGGGFDSGTFNAYIPGSVTPDTDFTWGTPVVDNCNQTTVDVQVAENAEFGVRNIEFVRMSDNTKSRGSDLSITIESDQVAPMPPTNLRRTQLP